jgi:hypothetical protein
MTHCFHRPHLLIITTVGSSSDSKLTSVLSTNVAAAERRCVSGDTTSPWTRRFCIAPSRWHPHWRTVDVIDCCFHNPGQFSSFIGVDTSQSLPGKLCGNVSNGVRLRGAFPFLNLFELQTFGNLQCGMIAEQLLVG